MISKSPKKVILRSFILFSVLFAFIGLMVNNFVAFGSVDSKEELTSEIHASDNTQVEIPKEHEKKALDIGGFILSHILDSYEIHIAGSHEHPIAIPLPIIIYNKAKGGFSIFSSAKLAHGHSFENYTILRNGFEFKVKTGVDEKGEPTYNTWIGNEIDKELVETNQKEGELVKSIKFYKGQLSVLAPDGSINQESTAKIIDLSITKTVLGLFIVALLMLVIFLSVAKAYKKRRGHSPKGLQSFLEPLFLFVVDDLAKPILGADKYRKYLGYLLTIFFFIFFCNLLGLIPGFGFNITGNISVALVLALITFVITNVNGKKTYWIHIVNMPGVPWWLKLPPLPLMPIVEILGIFIKPFVLMVRLFANMTAGHVIALGFLSLIFIFFQLNMGAGIGGTIFSVAFSIFMYLLELLVAFIQAYVFTLLAAIYFSMAEEEHHEAAHH